MFLHHDPDLALLIVHQEVSQVTCTMGIAPIRESCADSHFLSTDDKHTGPAYMNQLACEQKKSFQHGQASGLPQQLDVGGLMTRVAHRVTLHHDFNN